MGKLVCISSEPKRNCYWVSLTILKLMGPEERERLVERLDEYKGHDDIRVRVYGDDDGFSLRLGWPVTWIAPVQHESVKKLILRNQGVHLICNDRCCPMLHGKLDEFFMIHPDIGSDDGVCLHWETVKK